MHNISVVTFNARGLRARRKRRAIFRHLHIKYPGSIICLQETHSVKSDEQRWQMEWGGDIVYSHGTETAMGVAFLFPRENSYNFGGVVRDNAGRLLIIGIDCIECEMTLVGIYAPSVNNQEVKCKFLNELKVKLRDMPKHRMVLCGDFNIKLGARDSSSNFQHTRASKSLRSILNEYELVDIWRKIHPKEKKYTWRRTRPLLQSRIDYIFISDCLYRGREAKARIDLGVLSDHSFVYAEIDARKSVRGPGVWRFNNLLLADEKFRAVVKDEVVKCKSAEAPYEGDIHKGLLIELLLSNIRIKAMRRGKEIKRQQRKEEQKLAEALERLEQCLDNRNPEMIRTYEETKDRLEELKLKKGQWAILVSGARWTEHGEKPSKYFLNLYKKRAAQKSIVSLKSSIGEILTENKTILEYCAKYFKELFKASNVDIDSMEAFSPGDGDPKLSEEEKMLCEGQISPEECLVALKGMSKGKVPGISGFTAEFYVSFWEELGELIVDYIHEAFERKQFFINHVRGIIHLIPKKATKCS